MKTSAWKVLIRLTAMIALVISFSCSSEKSSQQQEEDNQQAMKKNVTAKDILGNPAYRAISYSGYRENTRDIQPTVTQIKEDMRLLEAMGIKVLRTYDVGFPHSSNILKAIRALKNEDPTFEMYVMLGAWINCQGAYTPNPNHDAEDAQANAAEIGRAINLTNEYADIVKVLAVGNEAMVKWAASYFVQPWVILKYVNQLQELKAAGKLPKDLWITSSDNFASWGGGGGEYHVEDLTKLIQAVDYISLHTYPMHDTHYNPQFWGVLGDEASLSDTEKIKKAMERARDYAKSQYESTTAYMKRLGMNKPVHIGETGWATVSNGFYGPTGSKATDQYKSALYHQLMRDWTDQAGISCFYFEAVDEPWKDAQNPEGSENHFGLFTVDGQAKYMIWDWVDKGVFEGLTRGGNKIVKTYGGDEAALLKEVLVPPQKN